MKNLIFLFLCVSIFGCKAVKIDHKTEPQLLFLDDYVIPADATYGNTAIGGLSGIDRTENGYLLICDDKSQLRFYRAEIQVQNSKIDTVIFTEVVQLETENKFFQNNYMDMEGIRQDPITKNIVITSEGSILKGKDPSIFIVSPKGTFLANYHLPSYFKADTANGPRNNGVFEGISNSLDQKGIWVATELPLKSDGPQPELFKTVSPVRITYYDNATRTAEKQFTYLLDPIAKVPLLPFYINGVTEILAVSPTEFLVLERGFSAGLGQHGNTVRIYLADISKATHTLEMSALRGNRKQLVPAKKTLLLDFDSIKKQLPEGIIDNIEGISFGPTLPNGHKSLLLIADNNFNSLGKQLNQLILLEFIPKQTTP